MYFRKSPKGRNRLGAIQVREFGIKHHKTVNLQVDCPTRWNSCLLMIQRFIDLEPALVAFFTHIKSLEGRKAFKDMEAKLRRPKTAEWLTIKCLATLLHPFSEVISELGGQNYPTISLVLPALSGIRK